MITRHGRPAAVLISADDLAALEETVDILATPGAAEAIAEGRPAAPHFVGHSLIWEHVFGIVEE